MGVRPGELGHESLVSFSSFQECFFRLWVFVSYFFFLCCDEFHDFIVLSEVFSMLVGLSEALGSIPLCFRTRD